MTHEQIENIAENYAYNECVNNETENQSLIRFASRNGFIEGAKWRIASVWHNIEEKANFLKLPILLQHKTGNIHFLDDRFSNWKYLQKYYTRWAYVKDLI